MRSRPRSKRHVAHGRAELKALRALPGRRAGRQRAGRPHPGARHRRARLRSDHSGPRGRAALRDYGAVLAADDEVSDPVVTPELSEEAVPLMPVSATTASRPRSARSWPTTGSRTSRSPPSAPMWRRPTSGTRRRASPRRPSSRTRPPGWSSTSPGSSGSHATRGCGGSHRSRTRRRFSRVPKRPRIQASRFRLVATAPSPDRDPLTYAWEFDDGATASGADVLHTFAEAGDHVVTLTTSDGIETVTTTMTISIQGKLVLTAAARRRATPACGSRRWWRRRHLCRGPVRRVGGRVHLPRRRLPAPARPRQRRAAHRHRLRRRGLDAAECRRRGHGVAERAGGEQARPCAAASRWCMTLQATLVLETRVGSSSVDPLHRFTFTGSEPFGTRERRFRRDGS